MEKNNPARAKQNCHSRMSRSLKNHILVFLCKSFDLNLRARANFVRVHSNSMQERLKQDRQFYSFLCVTF